MTKETKIGLLVGLAFIILFAIILSEKGTANRDAAMPTFASADALRKDSTPTGAERPLHNAGRLPVETMNPPPKTAEAIGTQTEISEEPLTGSVRGQPVPDSDEDLPPLPESLVQLLNESAKTAEQPKPAAKSEPTPSAVAAQDPAQPPSAAPAGHGSPSPKPESTTTVTVPLKDALAVAVQPETTAGNTSTEAAAESRSRDGSAPRETAFEPAPHTPTIIRAVHEVQPGESLGKIAAKYYGRATPARIEAIFNANRDVLKSTHQVRASDKLKIPELFKDDPNFEPAAFPPTGAVANRSVDERASPSQVRIPIPIEDRAQPPAVQRGGDERGRAAHAAPEPRPTEAPPAFEWYVVKEKDTLSTIAKRRLGDEKKFKDLYDLNRDLLPDRNKLKPGQKIRLPAKPTAAVNGGTALSSIGSDAGEF